MLKHISAEFDGAGIAEIALSRLREAGVSTERRNILPKTARNLDPTLFVSYPFPMNGNSMTSNQNSGLPQTTGNSLMMNTPLFGDHEPGRFGAVRLELEVPSGQLAKTRQLLVNCHGRSFRLH